MNAEHRKLVSQLICGRQDMEWSMALLWTFLIASALCFALVWIITKFEAKNNA